MKQKNIDTITAKILALNDNPEKTHEFLCACANAKSIVENKVSAEMLKKSIQLHMSNIINDMTRK